MPSRNSASRLVATALRRGVGPGVPAPGLLRMHPQARRQSSGAYVWPAVEADALANCERSNASWSERLLLHRPRAIGNKAPDRHVGLNKQILKCGDGDELRGVIERYASKFNPVNVATALRKVLAMKQAGMLPRDAADRAVKILEDRAAKTLDDFKPQDLATTAWAFAKMKNKPGWLLLSALEDRVAATATEFNSQDVAMTLWAFAKIGARPRELVLRALLLRAEAIAANFNAQDIANTLWAVATFDITPAEGEGDGSGEQRSGLGGSRCAASRMLRELEARTAQVAEQFNAQNVTNTLGAYARMGVRPREDVLVALLRRAGEIVMSFNEQGVVNTLSALAAIGGDRGAEGEGEREGEGEGEGESGEALVRELVRQLVGRHADIQRSAAHSHLPDAMWKLNIR